MPLIGDQAPAFKANTTNGPINFPADYKGKWVILFSHPSDFTPVCTTEFVMFQSMLEEFRALNTEVIGLSVDSIASHIAWLRTIEEKIEFKGIKGKPITFALIEDVTMNVSRLYGMMQPNASATKPVRAVFFIDPKGVVRALVYYPASTGRNFDELKRVLISLQTGDKFDVSTPADWWPGDEVVVGAPSTCMAADKRAKDKSVRCEDWFLAFKKLSKEELKKGLLKTKPVAKAKKAAKRRAKK